MLTFLVLANCGTAAETTDVSVGESNDGCHIFGTHQQVCDEEAFPMPDEEALPFYACFKGATCGLHMNGRCGWKMTPEIKECLRTSAPPPGRTPHADFHVHWDQPEKATPGLYFPEESLAYIDSMGITAGMLITNTYMAHRTPAMTVDELVEINRQHSDILTNHPNASKYQLLCGVSFQRADATELASRCLTLPKMAGMKLRAFTVRTAADLQKFEALVSVANEHNALVLSHFSGLEDSDTLAARTEDTEKIVSVMKRFPKAKLVIAHSGFSSFLGQAQLEQIGKHDLPNIFLETSDSFADFEDGKLRPDTESWFKAWRGFGLDRVMFGSDYPSKFAHSDAPLKFLTSTPLLSPAEAANVTRLTGETLAH